MGELILIVFFALGFFIMSYKYYQERKRYERCNYNRNHWLKKHNELWNQRRP